jgi:hypothetical protein
MNDGAHNVVITEDDDHEWDAVVEDKQAAGIGNSLRSFCLQIIIRLFVIHLGKKMTNRGITGKVIKGA